MLEQLMRKLRSLEAPYFHVHIDDPGHSEDDYLVDPTGIYMRTVRGSKMTRVDRLYDEFAAAFQFPLYFGENWDAFTDCIGDPTWSWNPSPSAGEPVSIFVVDSYLVLADSPSEPIPPRIHTDIEIFYKVLNQTALRATGIEQSGIPDRADFPFHVVLSTDRENLHTVRLALDRAGCEYEIP
jgi:barstar (barnase inhibitor)